MKSGVAPPLVHRGHGAVVVGGEELATPASLAFEAKQAGLDGVVVSGEDVRDVRDVCGDAFCLVVPGIRPAGSNGHDQVRVLTPREAIERGADYLVVGRADHRRRPIPSRARDRARSAARRAMKPAGTRYPSVVPRSDAVRILPGVLAPSIDTEGALWPFRRLPRSSVRRTEEGGEARKKRAELKGELKSGKRTLKDVLDDGRQATTPSAR